jgi:hypothetical protein
MYVTVLVALSPATSVFPCLVPPGTNPRTLLASESEPFSFTTTGALPAVLSFPLFTRMAFLCFVAARSTMSYSCRRAASGSIRDARLAGA